MFLKQILDLLLEFPWNISFIVENEFNSELKFSR